MIAGTVTLRETLICSPPRRRERRVGEGMVTASFSLRPSGSARGMDFRVFRGVSGGCLSVSRPSLHPRQFGGECVVHCAVGKNIAGAAPAFGQFLQAAFFQ